MSYIEKHTVKMKERTEKEETIKRMIDELPLDRAGRRVFTIDIKNMVLDYTDDFGDMNVYPLFKIWRQNIHKWRKSFKNNGKRNTGLLDDERFKSSVIATNTIEELLKDNSKVIGTTLSSILEDTGKKDILSQVVMVEALSEAGYGKSNIISKMNVPSIDEFKKIMDAVKLLSKDYTLTKKEK